MSFFHQSFITPSLVKSPVYLSHQLSINSDAVKNFTIRVYCTGIRSIDNLFSRIHFVINLPVYSSLIMR